MNAGHVIPGGNVEPLSGGRGPDSALISTAWRQELRRAFARGWFHGAMDPPESRVAGAAPQVRGGADVSILDRGASLAPGGRSQSPPLERLRPGQVQATVLSIAAVSHVHVKAFDALPADLLSARVDAMNTQVLRPVVGERPARAPETPLRSPSAEHQEGVRVHVEHGEQGATVWIGLDGEATLVGSQVQAIVAELARTVQGTPYRLAAVVCNGVVVYGNGSSPATATRKEAPWR